MQEAIAEERATQMLRMLEHASVISAPIIDIQLQLVIHIVVSFTRF